MKRQAKLLVERLETRELPATGLVSLLANRIPVAGYSPDGAGNNAANPSWGSAGSDLLRVGPAAYSDGTSSPAGQNRPSARVISNAVSDQSGQDIISDRDLSAMIYVWGQFIDHDLDLTPTGASERLTIPVPLGDPSFDPGWTGTKVIPTSRSIFDAATGTTNARQQINVITAFLDGSMVYGSDAATARALRTLVGGLLKTSAGDMLPFNNATTFPGGTLGMANDAHLVPNDRLYGAGDVRANENIELTAVHTLFVREHNYWAKKIAAANPNLGDEEIYQRARAIVIGEIQSITYNQWLPALLGHSLAPYRGYNAEVNPGISNEFSTAAFRLGHSLLGDDVEFLDDNGEEVADEVSLAQAFFNPTIVGQTGIDPILKYLATDPASEVDTKVVDSVRNFLFGPPGAGGLDLVSLNIQRGREHGLEDYNAARKTFGLRPVTSFAQITSDPELQKSLQDLYGSVNNIDLWVGALAEDHVRGGSVGPTLQAILTDQFARLRAGDRFWYQRTFSGPLLSMINHTSLTDIIRRNTDLANVQDNPFFFRAVISGTVYTDANGNHRQDRAERALAFAKLELVDADSSEVMASTTADARGNYRYSVADGLRTGTYYVRTVATTGTSTVISSSHVNITRGDSFSFDMDLGVAGSGGNGGPTGNIHGLPSWLVHFRRRR